MLPWNSKTPRRCNTAKLIGIYNTSSPQATGAVEAPKSHFVFVATLVVFSVGQGLI